MAFELIFTPIALMAKSILYGKFKNNVK